MGGPEDDIATVADDGEGVIPSPSVSAVAAVAAAELARSETAATRVERPRGDDGKVAAWARFAAGTAVGHYEVIRPLGSGGMGGVYLARDTRLGRRVALKFLLRVGRHDTARFEREARATAQLSHENIVALHDIAAHHGVPYMVLEYVPGKTLSAWLRERRATGAAGVPPERAAELMLPVARAVLCAHEAGIVHRDLKPANIMLADTGAVKVLDFGVAKLLADADDADLAIPVAGSPQATAIEGAWAGSSGSGGAHATVTGPGSLVGTHPYMAPEQWRAEPVDGRTDLWAIGIILYQLVTGEHPIGTVPPEALQRVGNLDEPMPSVRDCLPEIGPLGDVIDACLIKPRAARLGSARALCEVLEAIARPHATGARGSAPANPYAGLAAFQERDAARFFGREAAVAHVVARLAEQPLLALIGASGAGKSSLVRAGVIPALRHSGDAWEAFVLRPGPHPLAALADLVIQEGWQRAPAAAPSPGDPPATDAPTDHAALVARLRDEPGLLGALARGRSRQRRERILLVVDQFEEAYTLAAAPERDAWFACLAGAADDATSPLRVIIAIRHDFLDRVAGSSTVLAELVSRGTVLVGSLDRSGLERALVAPAEALAHRFESDALVAEMLAALAGTASALPILQFTAAKLWDQRDRDRQLLTEAAYRAFGGIGGALASHAERVLDTLSTPARGHARALLLRLVTPERTRAIVTRRELSEIAGDSPGELDRVIDRLIEARLVTVDGAAHEDSAIELIHESLIQTWPTLVRWLEEADDDAQLRARVRAAAQQWEAGGEAEGLLWRGDAEDEVRRWSQRLDPRAAATLSARDRRFIAAAVALGDRERRRQRRRVAAGFAALCVVVVAVSALAVRAHHAAALAEGESTQARNATRMAAARERLGDPTTVLALLREIEPGPPLHGWAELAAWAPGAGVAETVLIHPDGVWGAVFSPDGARIATGSADHLVRVWPADGQGSPIVLSGNTDQINRVAFSPDGARVVSAGWDHTVRVWTADGNGAPVVLRGHPERVYTAAFSPDGRRVVSASRDRTVRVWNADGTGTPLVLAGHDERVYAAEFSPDGARIASASSDRTVRVWNADGSGAPLVLRGHDAAICGVSWSPDGRRVASASFDNTIRVWSADGEGAPVVLRGHTNRVYTAVFSPDGRRIASASNDNTVRIWNADGSGTPRVLRGHAERVFTVAWSPDGRRVVSASIDHTVRVWDLDRAGPLVLRGHDEPVTAVAFSPDGGRIVSTSNDKTVRVWRTDGSGHALVLRGHVEDVNAVAFSPDGRSVASAGWDRTVRVWSADGAGAPVVFHGHDDRVYGVAFSRDGRQVASASNDHTVQVWNADGSGAPIVLRGHRDSVYCAAFSPDGQRIVSASEDRTVRVWRADGSGAAIELTGHSEPVHAAAFSPDGTRVASGSRDRTVRVVNADGSGQPLVLRGHDSAVTSVVWSAAGDRLLSSSRDGTVRIWRADGRGEPFVLYASTAVNMAAWSADERHVVAALDDGTLIVWNEFTPLTGADDPALWAATSYCPALELRRRLLNFSDEQLRSDLARCVRRVREVRAGPARAR